MAVNAWNRKPNVAQYSTQEEVSAALRGQDCSSIEFTTNEDMACLSLHGHQPQDGDVNRLEELMSEELARELQREENIRAGLTPDAQNYFYMLPPSDMPPINHGARGGQCAVGVDDVIKGHGDEEDVSSDWLMAQMLQRQLDAEHDKSIQRYEKAMNRNNKIAISYDQYKIDPKKYDSSDSDSSDPEAEEDWTKYYRAESGKSNTPAVKRGFARNSEGVSVTKHDAELTGRRNVSRMENFGPTFKSGDGTGMDLKLSNKVYKKLKTHCYKEENRAAKLHEKKDNSTAENAMDAKTSLMLMKFVDNGTLDSVGGCISTGKEANIYHAFGGPGNERISDIPEEVALKIHKTTLNEFKSRDQYIADDYRFKKHYTKQNSRKIVEQWALKEYLNLEKMKRNGIKCPKVVKVKKNVLIMEFLGEGGFPAPNLKEASLNSDDYLVAFEQSVQCIKDLYRKCKLVHADLSEYNLLWISSKIHVIDVSQSVDIAHPKAHQFLLRDCKNITSFFSKLLPSGSVPKDYELFNLVTGQRLESGEDLELLAQIDAFESNQELLTYQMTRSSFPFDYMYDKTALRFTWMPCDKSNFNSAELKKTNLQIKQCFKA